MSTCSTDEMAATGAEFWNSLRSGTLSLPYCAVCEAAFFFPRRWCPRCWSDRISWVPASGNGVVYATSVVHVPFQGVRPEDVPYGVALVDLAEGVRVPGFTPTGEEMPRAGDAVTARVETCDGKDRLVFYRTPVPAVTSEQARKDSNAGS